MIKCDFAGKKKSNDLNCIHIRIDDTDTLKDLLKELSQSKKQLLFGSHRVLPPDYLQSYKEGEIIFLDMRSAKVLDYDVSDQVITVETGISLKALDEILRQNNQWLPISGFTSSKTLFDVINCGDGGPLEHGFGGPRDLVLGLEIATADGDRIRTGGKVVKNVTGYDLTKLFIGSKATLGMACAAHLRLYARPTHSATLVLSGSLPEELFMQAELFIASGLPLSCLELIDLRLLKTVSASTYSKELLDSRANCVLFVQLHGHEEVIEEIRTQILSQCLNIVIDYWNVPAQEGLELSEKFSGLSEVTNLNCLELSLSPRLILDFFRMIWKSCGSHPFQCRPLSGRLKIFCQAEGLPILLKSLKDFSSKEEEPFMVSYPDTRYEFKVCRLPYEDAVSTQLKSNIKSKFDPANILNPVVLI